MGDAPFAREEDPPQRSCPFQKCCRPSSLTLSFGARGVNGGREEFHGFLRGYGLEPIIPVEDPTRVMNAKGSPTMVSHEETLRFRQDYTPVCSQNLPLEVLPSTLGDYPAQNFRCPMTLPGECPKECNLARVEKEGKIVFPAVRKRTSTLDNDKLLYQHPTFPRRGKQFARLLALRTVVERGNSLIRTVGRFGCDGEAKLPIRGLDNLRLRLSVTIITLNVLGILNERARPPGAHR